MSDVAAFLLARIDEDEGWARAIGGNTVVGEPGRWQAAPTGDQWAPSSSDHEVELLVALRPDAPRAADGTADLSTGHYGQVAIWSDDDDDLDQTALPIATFIARHDPARVLADCAAKRAIVDLHHVEEHWAVWTDDPDDATGSEREGCMVCTLAPSCPHPPAEEDVVYPCRTLRLLASVYVDHANFDPAWKLD